MARNEIIYVEDPTKFKPHTIHPTYKIAQDAYAKKLESVLYQIDVNQINSQLSVVETWSAAHPKSLNVANLLAEAKTAIANGESIASIKQKASLAIVEHQKRLAEQARRDRKKLGSKSIPTSLTLTIILRMREIKPFGVSEHLHHIRIGMQTQRRFGIVPQQANKRHGEPIQVAQVT